MHGDKLAKVFEGTCITPSLKPVSSRDDIGDPEQRLLRTWYVHDPEPCAHHPPSPERVHQHHITHVLLGLPSFEDGSVHSELLELVAETLQTQTALALRAGRLVDEHHDDVRTRGGGHGEDELIMAVRFAVPVDLVLAGEQHLLHRRSGVVSDAVHEHRSREHVCARIESLIRFGLIHVGGHAHERIMTHPSDSAESVVRLDVHTPPMSTNARIAPLRRQLDLTWSLAEVHLGVLTTADCLWAPTEHHWTIRRGPDDLWRPVWQVPEPDPHPVPTIGWLTWHLGWWWTTTLARLRGDDEPDEVTWPGDAAATVDWLRGLHRSWAELLEELTDADLDREAPFPWPEGTGRTVVDTVAWAHAELMKNVAEIGQLRLWHRAEV